MLATWSGSTLKTVAAVQAAQGDFLGQHCCGLDKDAMLYTVCSFLQVDSSVHLSRPLKNFLISIAMSQTEQKCSIVLDKQWKLPKMRYKGDRIVSQRIRVDSKPRITELGDVQEEPEFPLRFDKRKAPAKPKPAQSGGLLCLQAMKKLLSWQHGRPGTAPLAFEYGQGKAPAWATAAKLDEWATLVERCGVNWHAGHGKAYNMPVQPNETLCNC